MSPEAHGQRSDGRRGELRLPMDWERARAAQEALLDLVGEQGYPEASIFAIRLALEEAVANAFRHGNRNDPDKSVTLGWTVESDAIRITVEDEGDGFDPDALPDPRAPEHIERPHGRGVMLIRSYMTDVSYERGGRRLVMRYERPRVDD